MLLIILVPPIPRVFALIFLGILSACGSIQDNFTFQPMELKQNRFFKSALFKPKINKIFDKLILANINEFQHIPDAPILLLPPPDPRPNIPIDQLLAPSEPLQPLKPNKLKITAKPKFKRKPSFPIWDDLDRFSLIQAVKNHLQLLNQAQDKKIILKAKTFYNNKTKSTLEAFLNLLEQNLSQREFQQRILDNFEFFSAEPASTSRKILFTGYYTPVIEASRIQVHGYDYPIYRKPENLSHTRYIYRQRFQGEPYSRLHFIEGPNYTREDIDGRRILDNRHLEIAWLKDEMDRYFLHIQGSGVLKFPDGTFQGVQYIGSNGYGYQSVGKRLMKEGIISISQGSMQGIKKHFRENPQDIPKYVYQNKRYIFFKRSDSPPLGASGAPVVEGRSIAIDPNHYPYGALGLISTKKPILDDDHKIIGWKQFSRFVVAQDTGSAIKGSSHVDLYFGVGKRAAAAAGRFMQKGTLFFLQKKSAE